MNDKKEMEVINKVLAKHQHKIAGINSRLDYIKNARNYDQRDETVRSLEEMLHESQVIISALEERKITLAYAEMHKEEE